MDRSLIAAVSGDCISVRLDFILHNKTQPRDWTTWSAEVREKKEEQEQDTKRKKCPFNSQKKGIYEGRELKKNSSYDSWWRAPPASICFKLICNCVLQTVLPGIKISWSQSSCWHMALWVFLVHVSDFAFWAAAFGLGCIPCISLEHKWRSNADQLSFFTEASISSAVVASWHPKRTINTLAALQHNL